MLAVLAQFSHCSTIVVETAGLATPQATTPQPDEYVVISHGLATPQAATGQADVDMVIPDGLATPQATTPQADADPTPDWVVVSGIF